MDPTFAALSRTRRGSRKESSREAASAEIVSARPDEAWSRFCLRDGPLAQLAVHTAMSASLGFPAAAVNKSSIAVSVRPFLRNESTASGDAVPASTPRLATSGGPEESAAAAAAALENQRWSIAAPWCAARAGACAGWRTPCHSDAGSDQPECEDEEDGDRTRRGKAWGRAGQDPPKK